MAGTPLGQILRFNGPWGGSPGCLPLGVPVCSLRSRVGGEVFGRLQMEKHRVSDDGRSEDGGSEDGRYVPWESGAPLAAIGPHWPRLASWLTLEMIPAIGPRLAPIKRRLHQPCYSDER
jgi:hypothetical protein